MQFKSLMMATTLAVACSQAFAAGNEEQIRSRLEAINPQIQVMSVKDSPIEGVMEVALSSGETLFTSKDGEYFLLGQLYQAKGNGFVNLSEQRKKGFRAESLKALNPEDMVIFSPAGEVKATVYAFTDVDCGYCRKLHSEMADYNKAGIEIRYLAFPRAGVGSGAYNKMVSVWCADDRQQAMTQTKAGQAIAAKECVNPVAAQYQLGQEFGVNGTPALVFEDGSLMPGYVPADRLAAFIEMN
ncbi:DsbC family protein [Motiliproteus sediminis]|uniref:DsbC family protein n=1 Tax=Motiliproteus sediminis TaxID=1468178 RepID=UPI001FEC87DD|nr:DsbC family protein [Motiliproteus sediminis]